MEYTATILEIHVVSYIYPDYASHLSEHFNYLNGLLYLYSHLAKRQSAL